jgi:hypothetical protein
LIAILVAYEPCFAGRSNNVSGAWNSFYRLIFGRHGICLFCSAVSGVAFRHQAAERLYSALWQKDLGRMLMDVPNSKELKYLPKAEVDNLELRSLGYFENVLLVRKEYLTTMDILNTKSWKACGGHGVVIIGQSGIGKRLSQITVMLLTAAYTKAKPCSSIMSFFIV